MQHMVPGNFSISRDYYLFVFYSFVICTEADIKDIFIK